jgi:PAS domain S-box-containing protein
MVSQFPVGIIEVNSFKEIVAANATIQEWLRDFFPELKGLSYDKLIGIFQKQRGLPATEQDFPFEKVRTSKQSQPAIKLLLETDGQERWLMMHIEPAWQTDKVTGILMAFTDVTRFILVEQDLTKKEKKFRGLLESAPDAMVIVDEKGVIQLVNVQTEIMFEYQRDEIIGKPVELLLPQRYKHAHEGHRKNYFHNPKVRQMGEGRELYGLKKSGLQFPVEISLSPLETEEGILVSAAIRDITERRKAEEKFRGLLESAPDAIVIVDEQGLIQLVNVQTEKMFKYDRAEMIGQPVE